MTLKKLLFLQLTYCLLAITYNIVSYFNLEITGQALTTTPPIDGFFAMVIYGLFLVPALFGRMLTYKCLMCIAIIVYSYGGIVVHVLNYANEPALYFSLTTLAAGIGINLLGFTLNLYAVFFVKIEAGSPTKTNKV